MPVACRLCAPQEPAQERRNGTTLASLVISLARSPWQSGLCLCLPERPHIHQVAIIHHPNVITPNHSFTSTSPSIPPTHSPAVGDVRAVMSKTGGTSAPSRVDDDDLRPPPGHKRGKRIVHLLQEHRDQLQRSQRPTTRNEDSALQAPKTNSRSHSPPARPEAVASSSAGSAALSLAPSLTAGESEAALRSEFSSAGHSLLDVANLTRENLDDCISAFFTINGPAYRLSQHRQLILKRIQVLLYNLAGLEAPTQLGGNEDAASELLTLAIASIGAPFSSSPQLAQPLHDRCCALANDPSNLISDPLDATEAVLLLESASRPCQPFIGVDRRGDHGSSPVSHPLTLNPLGSGFAVDLLRYHGLHIAPPTSDRSDYTRRQSLFWITWESDALRMVSTGAPCRLGDADIGWPRPDYPVLDSFRWDLAVIGRQISTSLLSPRAMSQDYLDTALLSVIAALDDLRHPSYRETGTRGVVPAAEGAYVLSTHNLFYLVCWKAVRQLDLPVAEHASSALESAVFRATERMAELAKLVVKDQLLRDSPRVIRDHLAAFVLYLIQTFASTPWRYDDSSTLRVRLAQSFLEAVRSAAPHNDSVRLADVLGHAIQRASGIGPTTNRGGGVGAGIDLVRPTPTVTPTPPTSSMPSTPPTPPTHVAQHSAAGFGKCAVTARSAADRLQSIPKSGSNTPPLTAGLSFAVGPQHHFGFPSAHGLRIPSAVPTDGTENSLPDFLFHPAQQQSFAYVPSDVQGVGLEAFDQELLAFVASCGVEMQPATT